MYETYSSHQQNYIFFYLIFEQIPPLAKHFHDKVNKNVAVLIADV